MELPACVFVPKGTQSELDRLDAFSVNSFFIILAVTGSLSAIIKQIYRIDYYGVEIFYMLLLHFGIPIVVTVIATSLIYRITSKKSYRIKLSLLSAEQRPLIHFTFDSPRKTKGEFSKSIHTIHKLDNNLDAYIQGYGWQFRGDAYFTIGSKFSKTISLDYFGKYWLDLYITSDSGYIFRYCGYDQKDKVIHECMKSLDSFAENTKALPYVG